MALFGKKKETKEETPQETKGAVSASRKPEMKKNATVSNQNLSGILLRPRVTEKATDASGRGVYVFEVLPSATKPEIKKAVKELFNVNPVSIRTVTVHPRSTTSRMRGRNIFGTRAGGKKAYVYLKEGDRIEIV